MTTKAKHTDAQYREFQIEEYTIDREPYYLPVGDEIEVFTAAYAQKIPLLFKGPTGCGKTRFVEYMAWKLGRPMATMRKKGERGGGEDGHGVVVTRTIPAQSRGTLATSVVPSIGKTCAGLLSIETVVDSVKSRLPASTAPTGQPRPFDMSSHTVSICAA